MWLNQGLLFDSHRTELEIELHNNYNRSTRTRTWGVLWGGDSVNKKGLKYQGMRQAYNGSNYNIALRGRSCYVI